MEELMSVLESVRPDVDFSKEKALIDDEILDSFDVISIVGELNDVFEINVNPGELVPENFNSAEAIYRMVLRLKETE